MNKQVQHQERKECEINEFNEIEMNLPQKIRKENRDMQGDGGKETSKKQNDNIKKIEEEQEDLEKVLEPEVPQKKDKSHRSKGSNQQSKFKQQQLSKQQLPTKVEKNDPKADKTQIPSKKIQEDGPNVKKQKLNSQRYKQQIGIQTKNQTGQFEKIATSQDELAEKIQLKPIKMHNAMIRKFKNKSKNSTHLNQSMQCPDGFKSTNSMLKSMLKNNQQQQMDSTTQKFDNKTANIYEELNYKQENKKLKGKIKFLMDEIKNIEVRLNNELSKRSSSYKRKQRIHSVQSVSNREILNAERRCQIYRKQIQTLKHKNTIFNEERINLLTGQLTKLKQIVLQLQNEKKELKKSIKRYQKMIDQIDDGRYVKMREQLQNLKVQNRKLKQKLRSEEQDERLHQIMASNQKSRSKKEIQKQEEDKKKQQIREEKQINILKSKSARDDKRIKALAFENKNQKEYIEKIEVDIQMRNKQIESLKQIVKNQRRLLGAKKMLKNRSLQNIGSGDQQKGREEKMKVMANEEKQQQKIASNQKQSVEQNKRTEFAVEDEKTQKLLKQQKQEKVNKLQSKQQKQLKKDEMKEKEQEKQQLVQDRKQNIIDKELSSQEVKGKEKEDDLEQQNEKEQRKQQEQQYKEKTELKEAQNQPQKEKEKSVQQEKSSLISEQIPKMKIQGNNMHKNGKYPRIIQKGESSTQSYKWNHHAFSSKIKEIQVMPHLNGHIKCLNFRYEKGSPTLPEQGNYASFVCDENGGEFVKKIQGGFKNGILQYIKVATNKKRQATFCRHQLEEECQRFIFGVQQTEYPAAIFGENMNESITKIGCFVESLK